MSRTPPPKPAIPIVALGPEDDEEKRQWLAAIERTIEARAFCLGSEVARFEEECSRLLEVEHAFGVSSGTDGLRLAAAAVGVGPGDEVVVPAYSFFATASVIAHLGARPRFVDIEPETLTLDFAALPDAVGERTRAVMPVHLYGQAMRSFDALLAWCGHRDLPVIEDAAQAFGVRYQGRALGGNGAAGVFSFYPTKNLSAPGDAGLVITNHADIAERVRSLRVHGDQGGYRHEILGFNARMDGFQAAVLSVRLERLSGFQRAREENARRYHEALAQAELGDRVQPLGRTPGSDHGWHQFIVRVGQREIVRSALAEAGIQSAIYYPATIPSQPAFADLGHRSGEFPEAERAAREVLALPIHHRLRPEDPARVVAVIKQALEG